MSKKPLVSEAEWIKFSIREGNRIPREAMPHCFAMPVLSLPECNHLAGNTPNLCQLRQSCLVAYAERLKIDIKGVYEGGAETGYVSLVALVKEEEKRINFVPELGKKVSVPDAEPGLVTKEVLDLGTGPEEIEILPEEEITMASLVPEVQVKEVAVQRVRAPVATKSPGEPPMRLIILEVLSQSNDWISKVDLIGALEKRLGRSPLNNATLHKVSLVLLPKTQAKFGYKVDKKIEKGPGGLVYSYKINGTTQTY